VTCDACDYERCSDYDSDECAKVTSEDPTSCQAPYAERLCPVTCNFCTEDIDYCANVTCENGGTCDEEGKCACVTGYQGDRCETNTDDCADVTCKNGGVCRDGVNSYECACALGYKGTTCEASGFIQHQGKHISWGTPQHPAVTSVEKCAELCRNDGNCGFFDFNFGYFNDEFEGPYHGAACWLHDKTRSVKDMIKASMDVSCYVKQ